MSIYRLAFSLILLLTLFAAFLLFPSQAGIIAVCILSLGLGISVFSTLRRQSQQYRAGEIDRHALVRSSAVEITGMLSSLALSILLSSLTVGYVIAQVNGVFGLVLGMLAAALIGVVVSLLVQFMWGRLVK